jgi:hypothetical protein
VTTTPTLGGTSATESSPVAPPPGEGQGPAPENGNENTG